MGAPTQLSEGQLHFKRGEHVIVSDCIGMSQRDGQKWFFGEHTGLFFFIWKFFFKYFFKKRAKKASSPKISSFAWSMARSLIRPFGFKTKKIIVSNCFSATP